MVLLRKKTGDNERRRPAAMRLVGLDALYKYLIGGGLALAWLVFLSPVILTGNFLFLAGDEDATGIQKPLPEIREYEPFREAPDQNLFGDDASNSEEPDPIFDEENDQ